MACLLNCYGTYLRKAKCILKGTSAHVLLNITQKLLFLKYDS